ncbi:MAG: MlaD family protein [Planctomycetota bacterium]
MEDRNVKWRVGVVAVATVVITALLIAVSTTFEAPFGVGQYQVQIMVQRAPGVGRNTPVRRDGVLIGRVDSTEPVPGGRLITARINESEPILESDRVQIRPSSLFGDAVIEFAQTGQPADAVEPGAVVQGRALPDPIETLTALDVGPAVESLGRAGESVAELATRINAILGDEADGRRLATLLDDATAAMDEFSATMKRVSSAAAAIDSVVGDPAVQQDLKQTLAGAPRLMTDLRGVTRQAASTIATLDSAIVSAERNLRNIEGLSKPLGERGPELAQSVISALENLDVALADISRFANALNDSEGTIGQLVNNPDLYNNVNATVYNANLVIARLDRLIESVSPQIRAIVNDVRAGTDKFGREPGRVLKGALGRGSQIK